MDEVSYSCLGSTEGEAISGIDVDGVTGEPVRDPGEDEKEASRWAVGASHRHWLVGSQGCGCLPGSSVDPWPAQSFQLLVLPLIYTS